MKDYTSKFNLILFGIMALGLNLVSLNFSAVKVGHDISDIKIKLEKMK